jgi:predicted extracellular nuclease
MVLAPVINEFMASNDGALLDGDGQSSDWIEIYNPTNESIDLTGWHLTDNSGNLDKWTFQPHASSILNPGEYLIVFASGQTVETYIDPGGFAHTDFKLSASGEYLALTDQDHGRCRVLMTRVGQRIRLESA